MICVSLAGSTFQECKQLIVKSEFAEIRMDQLAFTNDQFAILFGMKKKSIATCRPGLDNHQRLSLLKLAIESGAGYVDIEYESDAAFRTELIKDAHSHHTLVMVSYHNFELTPSVGELEEIINKSIEWGADRVKITTTAQTREDCARVMALYQNYQQIIAFCMGKMGTITRVAAPLLGADFTYAAISRELATAPGQLTVEEYLEVYGLVGR